MNPVKYPRTAAVVGCCLLLISVDATYGQPFKPNIIVVFTDDQGWADLSCQESVADIRTPHTDRLAREGVRFNRAYCRQAICGPSRTSLMTGLRPITSGIVENSTFFRETMPDVVTLSQHFGNHGYATAYLGKVFHPGQTDDAPEWESRKLARSRTRSLAT